MSASRNALGLVLALAASLVLLPRPLALEPAETSPRQALFEQACDAYRRGSWAEAQAGWESLLAEPGLPAAERSRLTANLGNAAWRAGRRNEALGWFTAAVRLDPANEDARANRDLARSQAGLSPARGGDLRTTVEELFERWPDAERRRAVLAGLGLCALVLLGEALRGGRAWRAAALVATGLLVLASVPWAFGLLRPPSLAPVLVVAEPSAALRSEPRESLDPIAKVRLGDEVERIDRLPGWVRVRTEDGARGWVAEDAVFELAR